MNTYIGLAWRNIWRNKKRSLISIASILFAVLIALVMRSMQTGYYARSIDNVVSFYTGYIQVHADGYSDEPSVNRSFALSDSLTRILEGIRDITFYAPRLEEFALVSGGKLTDGAMIVGIDPQLEDRMTSLRGKVTAGDYLNKDDAGIMLAEELANHLQLGVGDTIVVLGQGYHGLTAAGRYRVGGIVKFPSPDQNKTMVYMTIAQVQELTGADGRLTSLALMIRSHKLLDEVSGRLREELGGRYEVKTWKEIMPEMVQFIQMDNASGLIMLFVVYMVIAFGIFGAILMMTMERTREFGMLISIGMKRSILRVVVVLESVMLSLIGVMAGVVFSFPIILYFHRNPIKMTGNVAEMTRQYGFEAVMPFSLDPWLFYHQALIVLLIALVAATYPLVKITRMDSARAMREG
jgi:ABC-type lipoprotein release transport system permease subunit